MKDWCEEKKETALQNKNAVADAIFRTARHRSTNPTLALKKV